MPARGADHATARQPGPERATRRPGRARPTSARVLLAVLVAGFLCLGAIEAWRDAPTYDEPVYISSGLAALLDGNLSLNAEHPPPAKILAALPALLAGAVMPPHGTSRTIDEHIYSAAFVRAQRAAGTLRAVDFAARIVPLLECIALALLLYALANALFGAGAGLLCAALWLASPLVLGLGHLDGVDLPFALAVVGFSWTLLRWMRGRRRRQLVALGIAGGLVALTNASGLLIVICGAVLVPGLVLGADAHRSAKRRARSAALAALTFLLGVAATIWLCYLALDPALLLDGAGVLPQPYLDGLRFLAHHDTAAAASYLLGVAWTGGRWWYWPVSLLIKLPPATLAVLVLGPMALVCVDRQRRREALLVTVLPGTILLAFDIAQPRDIGVRYLLAVIALWLVAASAAATLRSVVVRGALVAAVALGVWSTVASFPSSLSWTDPLFGASYRVATNSTVDWGQDFYLLEDWIRTRAPNARVAYFGTPGLTLTGAARARPLLGVAPARITGWVAVSATDLTTLPSLSWLRAYCPVQRIGTTVLVYRFAAPPSSAPGPSEPAALCPPAGRRESPPVSRRMSVPGRPVAQSR